MAEKTIYERAQEGMCFGYITAVFPDERMCSVQTFGTKSYINDNPIPKCQWLSMDSNPEGDEATSIPRVGAYCVVIYVGGEPFVLGYFRGLNGNKGAGSTNAYKGVQGDKIISTVGGNRIVVKRSGLIEIRSKETLKRLYMPTESRLIDICRNYELKTDGGFFKWTSSGPLNTTKFAAEYRQNPARVSVLYDEIGGLDATTIYRRTVGTAIPGVEGVSLSQFKHEIKTTGENFLQVSPPGGIGGVSATISPTGEISVGTGLAPINQFALKVAPDGTTTLDVNKLALVTIDKTGAVKAENKLGSISLSEAGDLELKNKVSAFSLSAAGKVKIQGMIAELLELFDRHLEQQQNILTAILALSVGTGTGPSSPPINSADFAKALGQIMQIKMLLSSMKG